MVLVVVLVLAETVVGNATFFNCSMFLIYSPCGVCTMCDWGVSILYFTTP